MLLAKREGITLQMNIKKNQSAREQAPVTQVSARETFSVMFRSIQMLVQQSVPTSSFNKFLFS